MSGRPVPPRRAPTDDLSWREQAACGRARNPDRFLVARPKLLAHALAREFCADCPVRLTCLAYARTTRSQGVWGGWWFPARGYGEPVDLLGGTG